MPSKNRPQPNRLLVSCLQRCYFYQLAANKESVSSEDGLVVAVFEQVANAVLGVAWSVQSLDLDVTNAEGLAMRRCLCDFAAVLSTDDGERVCFELGQESILQLT